MSEREKPRSFDNLSFFLGLLGIVGAVASFGALSKRQRESIIERDGGRSQMRHYSEERGFFQSDPSTCKECEGKGCKLQVHHIEPQRYAQAVLNLLATDYDEPYNLITLYECEHNGRLADGTFADPKTDFVVHPDMIDTFKAYRAGDTKAFDKMFARRNELLAQGLAYWNPLHDDEFKEVARILTDNAVTQGWRFPEVKHKK